MRTTFVTRFCAALGIVAALAAASPAAEPLVEQGRAALGRGDTDAAIVVLEKAVVQYPKSAAAAYCLGSAYGQKAQQAGMMAGMAYAPKMKEAFEKAVALDPRHLDARYSLVQFYSAVPPLMGGSTDKALELAKAIKAIDPLYGHRACAFVYTTQKQPDLAKKEYLDGIREQPDSPRAHGYYGQYLAVVEKNYAAAFIALEAALKRDANYMPAYYHLGRAAALADTNLARGEEALRKYIAYAPKENEPPLANAHYYLGLVCEKEGKKAEAKQNYETALKLNPTLKDAPEALKRVS
jgi:tetratricopeptide (TPR) repeat protein